MNAILRNEYEATVLTHEAIEVHLSYLRPAVEGLSSKLDKAVESLNERLDRTNEKVDQANKDRATGDAMLAEKIDQGRNETNTALDELRKAILRMDSRVSAIDSRLAAIVWVGGGLIALITVAVTVGQAFKWL